MMQKIKVVSPCFGANPKAKYKELIQNKYSEKQNEKEGDNSDKVLVNFA